MGQGYKRQLYWIYIKKFIKQIPVFIVCSCLITAVVGLVYWGLSFFYGDHVTQMKIAYCTDREDPFIQIGMQYVAANINCKFVHFDAEEAYLALKNHKVAAVIELHDDKIHVEYSDSNGVVSKMFGEMILTGAKDYMVLSGSNQLVIQRLGKEENSGRNVILHLVKYLLSRNRSYQRKVYDTIGNLPQKYAYVGNAILVCMIMGISAVLGLLRKQDGNFQFAVSRLQITYTDFFFASHLPAFIVLETFLLLSVLAYQLYGFEEIDIILTFSVFCVGAEVFLFVSIIQQFFRGEGVAVLASILSGIALMFLSGNILPINYLPEMLQKTRGMLFTWWAGLLCGQIVIGVVRLQTLLGNVLWLLVMLVINIICVKVGKKNDSFGNNMD